MTDAPIPFAIVGGGWRAAFYLRVAAALPDRFRVTGVLRRDPGRIVPAGEMSDGPPVPVHATLDALLAARPAFVVVSVPRSSTAAVLAELAARRVPALAETPPAADLASLDGVLALAATGAPIQVAEQYRFQPLHVARLAVVASGVLGRVTQAQVSVAHDYHGTDLLRRYLGLAFEPVTIRATSFTSPIVAGPDRSGPPAAERIEASGQVLAWLDAGDRLGVYDFTPDQYFSWIRSPRVLVRGERGEIADTTVRWLLDHATPVTAELVRRDTGQDGNLDGHHHAGYTLGERWVHRNAFAPSRLSDDELAVASCLARMAEHVEGGPGPCSLAEAAWDQELGLWIEEAARTGAAIRTDGSRWAAVHRA